VHNELHNDYHEGRMTIHGGNKYIDNECSVQLWIMTSKKKCIEKQSSCRLKLMWKDKDFAIAYYKRYEKSICGNFLEGLKVSALLEMYYK